MAKAIPMVLHQGNVWVDAETGELVDAPRGQKHPAEAESKSIDVGASKATPVNTSGFADTFPGKKALEAAGHTLESVKGLDKAALVAISGIQDKTASAILEALEG